MTRKVVNFCTRVGFFLKVSKISNFIGTRVHLALARKQSLREQPATKKKTLKDTEVFQKLYTPTPTHFFLENLSSPYSFFLAGEGSPGGIIYFIYFHQKLAPAQININVNSRNRRSHNQNFFSLPSSTYSGK